MTSALRDRWVLILGASSGMGRAIAVACARQGAHVLGVHLDGAATRPRVDELLDTLRGTGVKAELFNANAARHATRTRLVEQIAGYGGEDGVALVVHSLAFGALGPYLSESEEPAITPQQMDMTLNVMAHSLVYWSQDLHRAGQLRPGARIMALTSAGGTRVQHAYGAVSAAKAALESHVRQLALEFAPHRVAVNALRAGVTLTPALERIPGHEGFVSRALESNPHNRLTTVEDVAEAALMLSEGGTWVTGN
ncbi:MAG: SDR family oxidoreductase, partial [Stackebrandtia sp.]